MIPFRNAFSSVIGAFVGVVFFAGSFALISWNENRSVQTERSLGEGQDSFVTASSDGINAANNGKLVYVSGQAKAANPLVDPVTHLSVPALVLERQSEMYQWIEESEKSGNSKQRTYTYREGWRSGIDSHQGDSGTHRNPASYTIPSGTEIVPQASLGTYQVSSAILGKIGAIKPYTPEVAQLNALPANLRDRVKLTGSTLYLGKNPAFPAIGDERVEFEILPPGPISIIARQVGESLAAHTTSNGREILLAESGVVTAEAMFEHAFKANQFLTWILRAGGALVMFIGLRMVVEPLTKLTDWIPLVGGLVDLGATLASGVLAVSLSLVTIAVAWFAVRPLLSGALIVGAGGLVWLFRKPKRKTR